MNLSLGFSKCFNFQCQAAIKYFALFFKWRKLLHRSFGIIITVLVKTLPRKSAVKICIRSRARACLAVKSLIGLRRLDEWKPVCSEGCAFSYCFRSDLLITFRVMFFLSLDCSRLAVTPLSWIRFRISIHISLQKVWTCVVYVLLLFTRVISKIERKRAPRIDNKHVRSTIVRSATYTLILKVVWQFI